MAEGEKPGKLPLLFTLFRIQVHMPAQLPLLAPLRSSEEVLKAALLERPSEPSSSGSWRIGNVEGLPPSGLYFAIGREQPKRLGTVDDAGDFHNLAAIVAPNTHALVDLHYQVLAIAKNTELAPQPKSVARKLAALLSDTEVVQAHEARVSIGLITDPTEFLTMLAQAAAVTKFQVHFGLPNVWDADTDFQQPMQETARKVGADEAIATFKGDDLDRENLVKLTRAATAIGKRATAWVRRKKAVRSVQVKQKENAATVAADAPDPSQTVRWGQATLAAIRSYYEEIRDRE